MRAVMEEQAFKNLASEFKAKALNVEAAFSHFDSSKDGKLTVTELTEGFQAMKL